MSGVSLPVSRPVGRALLVGSPPYRVQPRVTLQGLGFACAEADDPYLAMRELCRRAPIYDALILSLSSLYREELQLVSAVKRRFPQMEVWLADTDGRQAALADGMRLGADGLLADDGLHRIAMPESSSGGVGVVSSVRPQPETSSARLAQPPQTDESEGSADEQGLPGEPVLTADELRALLQDAPAPSAITRPTET